LIGPVDRAPSQSAETLTQEPDELTQTAYQEPLFSLPTAEAEPRSPRRLREPRVKYGDRAAGPTTPAPTPSPSPSPLPEVEVRVGRRRRKTATAFWSEGKIVVLLPVHLRGEAKREMVDWLVQRVMTSRPRSVASDDVLFERATFLASRYVKGVRPASVRWVTNQEKRWGSCTVETGDIRLSHRLKGVPNWVLDAVLVHELAHLVSPDHSPEFHAIADRYPRQQEASTFLDGYALGIDNVGASMMQS